VPPFHRISYTDAVAKLKELGGDMEWGRDLGGEDETTLAKQYDPAGVRLQLSEAVKAFYMKEKPGRFRRTVLNNDCLAPGGIRRDHWRQPARTTTTSCWRGFAPSNCRKRRIRGIWISESMEVRALRFGLGVERTVAWDLWHSAYPGSDRIPAHTLPAVP